MSGETTLGRIGSKFTEYFSGITRESVGQFCTAKKDYVVSCVRNIPGFMQESHSNAAIILIGANVLCHAILDFTVLSPVERRMEASTTDRERLLTKKKCLNLLGAGAAFYFLNIGLTRLHKYELSPTQLLLITALVVSYRLFRLTMPQVVLPTQTPEQIATQTQGAAALKLHQSTTALATAEQAAIQAEGEVPDPAQQPLAGALEAQAQLPELEATTASAFNNEQMQAVVNACREELRLQEGITAGDDSVNALQQQIEAAQNELAGLNLNQPEQAQRHEELTRQLDGVEADGADEIVGLRAQHQQATDAVAALRVQYQQAANVTRAAREAAGQEQNSDNVPGDSLLGQAIAAQNARNAARQLIRDNQEALAAYAQRAETARLARETANTARQTAAADQAALDALLNPAPAP